MRQRALQAQVISVAVCGDKEAANQLSRTLKIHGDYTEGFHKKELEALRQVLTGKK